MSHTCIYLDDVNGYNDIDDNVDVVVVDTDVDNGYERTLGLETNNKKDKKCRLELQ